MQTKELIKALRAKTVSDGFEQGQDRVGANTVNTLTMKTKACPICQRAADALEATLWRDDVENAPLWEEVSVKYSGPSRVKSQPNSVGTSVRVGPNEWALGSAATHRKFTHWKPLTPPEEE